LLGKASVNMGFSWIFHCPVWLLEGVSPRTSRIWLCLKIGYPDPMDSQYFSYSMAIEGYTRFHWWYIQYMIRIDQVYWSILNGSIEWPLDSQYMVPFNGHLMVQVYQVYTMFKPICLVDVPRASPPSPSTRRFFAAGPLDFGMTSTRKPVVMGYGSLWVCPTIYTPPKKTWFIRKLIIIQNHSSSLPIIVPSKISILEPQVFRPST